MRIGRVLTLLLLSILLTGCRGSEHGGRLVIWVTGGLRAGWLPHNELSQPESGGLLRIARALDLYRRPGDLLVDLGRFRYPEGVSGGTRSQRIQADGFLKTLARMEYTGLNVSLLDLGPWPPELAARAGEYNLPLISCNIGCEELLFLPLLDVGLPGGVLVQIIGLSGGSNEFMTWLRSPRDSLSAFLSDNAFRIVLSDASESIIREFCQNVSDINLVIWLNEGEPSVGEVEGIPILGMGDAGNCLGRIEVQGAAAEEISIVECDLNSWTDRKPYRHHPVRERLLSWWTFWKKPPVLRTCLWAVPNSISPQIPAETQKRQTEDEDRRLTDLENVHRETRTEYAGPRSCLGCHGITHPRDLAKTHEPADPSTIAGYPVYERCLGCHATGFDVPGGFLLPWERPDLRWVSCEACHGAAYDHALEGKPPYPQIPQEPLCQNCHCTEYQPSDHPKPEPQ